MVIAPSPRKAAGRSSGTIAPLGVGVAGFVRTAEVGPRLIWTPDGASTRATVQAGPISAASNTARTGRRRIRKQRLLVRNPATRGLRVIQPKKSRLVMVLGLLFIPRTAP